MFPPVFIAFLIVSFHQVLSLPFIDECLQVKSKEGFDVDKFGGKWYEILRVNISVPVLTKCHAESYMTNDKFLIISGEFMNPMTKNYSYMEGVGAMDPAAPSKFIYNFPSAHVVGALSVIDTDYGTYAALHTCNTYEFFKIEHFWILSRQRTLSPEIVKKLLSEYETMGGNVSSVIYINQTDCSDNGKVNINKPRNM